MNPNEMNEQNAEEVSAKIMPFDSNDILSVEGAEEQEAPEAFAEHAENGETAPDAGASEEVGKTRADVEVISVAFRSGGKAYYFDPGDLSPKAGEHVIVETARGVEYGTVRSAKHSVPSKDIVSPLKPVIRLATEKDAQINEKNHEDELSAAVTCKKKIRTHALNMKLVGAEYTFDRAKLTFYFTCESRVDFRELVRDLASTFRTRIELRQVGIRDEARIMGGISLCGRTYCCSGFLTDFVQVSIKMAKEQNFALNSSKATGACGRLMCCLNFEHEVYEEAIRVTPPVGTPVRTHEGEGTVCEMKPLLRQVKVRYSDKSKETTKWVSIDELELLNSESLPREERTEPAKTPKKVQKRFDPILDKVLSSQPDGKPAKVSRTDRQKGERKSEQDTKPRKDNTQRAESKPPRDVSAQASFVDDAVENGRQQNTRNKPRRRFFRPKKKGSGDPGQNNT